MPHILAPFCVPVHLRKLHVKIVKAINILRNAFDTADDWVGQPESLFRREVRYKVAKAYRVWSRNGQEDPPLYPALVDQPAPLWNHHTLLDPSSQWMY
jgi:hypothetical protein